MRGNRLQIYYSPVSFLKEPPLFKNPRIALHVEQVNQVRESIHSYIFETLECRKFLRDMRMAQGLVRTKIIPSSPSIQYRITPLFNASFLIVCLFFSLCFTAFYPIFLFNSRCDMRAKMRPKIRREVNLGYDLRIGSVGMNISRVAVRVALCSPELKKEVNQCKKKRNARIELRSFDISDYRQPLISCSDLTLRFSWENSKQKSKKRMTLRVSKPWIETR